MQRIALVLVLLGVIVGAGLFAHSLNPSDSFSSNNLGSTVTERETIAPETQQSDIVYFEQAGDQREASGSFPPESTSESAPIARWIREANSDDAHERAAAISALGRAPKSLAVPVLQKIVGAGADGDREQALNSLRALALEQGDADGVIRDTLRLTVYDGDDYMVADAQAVLEEIEQNQDEIVNDQR